MKKSNPTGTSEGTVIHLRKWQAVLFLVLFATIACLSVALATRHLRASNDSDNGNQIEYEQADVLSANLILAKRFVITDHNGKAVGFLKANQNGAGTVALHDADGNLAIEVSPSFAGGSGVTIYRQNRKIGLMLSVDNDGTARVSLFNENEQLGSSLEVDQHGNGRVLTLNSEGEPSAALLRTGDGDGRLRVFDRNGTRTDIPQQQGNDADLDNK